MPFQLITTQVEEFETKAELEHHIKEHAPLDFDDKVDLLKSGKIVIDAEDDALITIEAVETKSDDKKEVKNG